MSSTIRYPFEHPAAELVMRLFADLQSKMDRIADLSGREQVLWDIRWFEVEVMNGGFHQYFYNATGDRWDQCLQALRAIGANQSYRLLKGYCDLFPMGRPDTRQSVRQSQLAALTKGKTLDDVVRPDGSIEKELYQLLLDYYQAPTKRIST